MSSFLKALAVSAVMAVASNQAQAAAGKVKVVQTGTAHDAFFGLAFEGQNGIAVGAGGKILESTDGGATWKPAVQKASQLSLLGVDRHGAYGIAVGQMGTILTRQESGEWTAVKSDSERRLLSVSVNSKGVAVVTGEFGTMLKSTDGGQTWASVAPDWASLIPNGAEPHIYSVQIGEGQDCIAVGEFGMILRSSDGCATWTPVQAATEGAPSLFAIRLTTTDSGAPLGFAVGQSGAIYRSIDGGRSWTPVQAGAEGNLLGVDLSANGHVLITGIRGMLSSNDLGLTFTGIDEEDIATSWYQTARTPARGATVVTVGHSGRILQVSQ